MQQYKVQSDNFKGPLYVLLRMIEKRKLTIHDFSLAEITEDYIKFVKNLGDQSFSNTTSFFVIISTLILIKSKSLLPFLNLSDEEEIDIENLKHRLELLKLFNFFTPVIQSNFGKEKIFFALAAKKVIKFRPCETLLLKTLSGNLENIFANIPVKEKLFEKSVKKIIHIEEVIDSIKKRLQKHLNMNFKDILSNETSEKEYKEKKIYTVIAFLSILELFRDGIININQNNTFDDILLTSVKK